MTKEITKSNILQEMQDKFQLREYEPSKFLFSEEVIPVYNIEPHLKKWQVERKILSITSAAAFTFFETPPTERWVVRAYQVIYGMTGAIKGTGLLISNRPAASNELIYLDMKKNQEVSYLVNLPTPVVLEPGNALKYNIDTYVSTQNLEIDIDVQKEEIR